MWQIFLVCVAVALFCFIAYKIGEHDGIEKGVDDGILMGQMVVLQKFGEYQNKVVELVPPNKHEELKALAEHFYDEINKDE